MEPIIADSARKHAVAVDDMLHALRNPVYVFDLDDDLVMIVGPDRAGALIEVGYVVASDGTAVIVHAMRPVRPNFLR